MQMKYAGLCYSFLNTPTGVDQQVKNNILYIPW